MRRKHLESALSSLRREFPEPNILLEQYPTSAQLTASVILLASENGDLGPGQTAIDLGCGTGMLTAGCAFVECDHVIGIDCDSQALLVARENVLETDLENSVSFILAKVEGPSVSKEKKQRQPRNAKGRSSGGKSTKVDVYSDDDGVPLRSNCVDTVVTNPPFGTKHNAGMDMRFLRTATRLARTAVYSFHKTSTRAHLMKTLASWGMEAKVVAEMKFDVPQTYKFHTKKSVDVEVDLLRVQVSAVE